MDLLDWIEFNSEGLKKHNLYGTGTTSSLIANELGLTVHRFKSGPLGGRPEDRCGYSGI